VSTETITIEIDPSLMEHVRGRLAKTARETTPEALITALVTSILDNSGYPIAATRTGAQSIRISYDLRSFAEPIL
jgi:predicted amidohydrolase